MRSLILAAAACATFLLYSGGVGGDVGATRITNRLVDGRPVLECGSDEITVRVTTETPFFGRLYVKGQSHEAACSTRGDGQTTAATLRVPLDRCFLRRQRVLEPFIGILVTAIVVVGFHPSNLITEADSVYRLQCVYTAGRQRVATRLDVRPTPAVAPLHDGTPMPNCRYEILADGPKGRRVPVARVGALVYHKWHCDADPQLFCASVHSCIAEDGVGTRIEILDDRGCSRDARILDNLEYLDPLTAGQTARVAKFADREVVYFECQIAITRRDRGECLRPTCDLKVVKRQQPPRLFTPQVLSNVNLNESMALEVVSELQTLDMIEEDAFDEHPVDNCFDTSIMPLLVLVVVLLVFVSFTSLLTRLFASRLDHRSSCIAQPRLND